MAPSSKSVDVLETLYESVAAIFEQTQLSLANHKKNSVALYKLHLKAVDVTQPGKNGKGVKLVGEKAFQDVVIDMISRVLVVKKGPVTADRTVKYVGAFVKFMNEKVIEAKAKTASTSSASAVNGNDDEEADDETPTSRFVSRLLNWLLQGFGAKNKIVRYRCIQVVSEMISHLGEIDEDAYNELRDALIERLNDKETLIRTHAVIALSKLAGSEDPEEVEQEEQTITQTLIDTLCTDPAAEVRRAVLVNLPLTASTIDTILTRTRDLDAVTRKLVYSTVLQTKLGHPRHLSIAQREQVVKDGLGDREPVVRVAAGKLVTSWFDAVLAEPTEKENGKEKEAWEGDDAGVMKGLVRFLGMFDVVGPGEVVATDAVLSIFTTRPEMPEVFVFPANFWTELTPESAVLARIFVEHSISSKNENRLESASLPVVTAFAFHVQEAYNGLLGVLEEIETAKLLRAGLEDEENEELEEELSKREVVMSELLRMALKLDYGDEIGRRKVFSVVRDMLAHPQLPPGLIERCLDVLKEIMPSERDLIRVIVEIVVELREGEEDGENPDEPPLDDNQSDMSQATIKKPARKKDRQDLSAEERAQADLTDIRCLMLCIAMLERVNGTFEDNSTLEGILADLIIPSVKRKELVMREKALISLGLCCLIAKNMALSSFQLFLSQAQNAPPELKVQVLRVIMDLLIMYDQEFFGRSEETATQIVDFLLQILEVEESAEAQAILVTGLCKLLLAGIVTQTKVLTALALMYISPTTSENQQVRQCLSYFFPVYSYSSPKNQDRMQGIFMPTFDLAVRMHEDLEDGQEMITPHQFGLLMVDWTDPQKAAEIAVEENQSQTTPHVNLAIEILIALYDSDRTVDQQKALCQLLGQLHIVQGLEDRAIHKLDILLTHHEEQTPFENSAVEKIFDRFKNRFAGIFAKELKGIDKMQFVDDEFREIYQRIGVDVPGEGDDDGNGRARGRGSRGKRRAKRGDDYDDEEEEEEEEEVEEEEVEEDDQEEGEEVDQEEKVPNDVDDAEKEQEAPAVEETVDESQAETEKPEDGETPPDTPVNSPTPPPAKRARQPTARKTSRSQNQKVAPPAAPRGGRKAAVVVPEDSGSDEENIPPPTPVEDTPKKKGVKRAHTPGSGQVASPANRKRTRMVKAPLQSTAEETTDVDNDSPSPSPAKPVRQTRRGAAAAAKAKAKDKLVPIAKGKGKAKISQAKTKAKAKAKDSTPELSVEEGEDSEDEVADSLTSPPNRAAARTGAHVSSDDFGGYSD